MALASSTDAVRLSAICSGSDAAFIVKFVRGRRTALFSVVDGDAFDAARSGLAIAARTDGLVWGGRDRLEALDRVLFGR